MFINISTLIFRANHCVRESGFVEEVGFIVNVLQSAQFQTVHFDQTFMFGKHLEGMALTLQKP